MKKERLFELLAHTDEDLIARAEARRTRRPVLIRWGVIAACIALLLSLALLLPLFFSPDPTPPPTPEDTTPAQPTQPPEDTTAPEQPTQPPEPLPPPSVPYTPDPVGVLTAPDALGGRGLIFVQGSSASLNGGGQSEPPRFEFVSTAMVVKVAVVQSLPDTYYKLDTPSDRNPTAYRLIQMQTLKVLHGENIPETFLYLIPEFLFADMSVYDSLYISMTQIGLPQYVLRNGTQSTMQAFDLPVFADYQELPQLGNIIAFTDGVFDESLWQNDSWIYGYQFAQFALDNPSSHSPLVVYRGYTEQQTEDAIAQEIAQYREWLGENYRVPSPVTAEQLDRQAQEALAYVAPFENGVFSQALDAPRLTYRRYINGVQTEETITIDLNTQQVTYSDVRYTADDYEKMENIALRQSELADTYAADFPSPPRIDTAGKDLVSLSLYGWYVKTEQGIYGIMKTVWVYRNEDDWMILHYDDDYTLYDAQNARIYEHLTPQEVFDITGDTRNVYRGDYSPIEIPM